MEFHTKGINWKHKKTGNLYYVLMENVIECTNGREEIKYVVYMSAHTGMKFCREAKEFYQKFEPCE
jgi:hypothetical protein